MAKKKGPFLPALYLGEAWRRTARHGRRSLRSTAALLPQRGLKLLVAPTDLRVVDPHVADEILQGRLPLAGRILEFGRVSPFTLELPSHTFAESLHSFSWLRHIRAHRSREAAAQARFILDSWIRLNTKRRGIAWQPQVLAQRIISWLSHSPVVLQNCEAGFYRRFLKSLGQQVAYARIIARDAPDGLPRMKLAIALAMASLAMAASERRIRAASRALDLELERQILPDGGHVSRNPQAALRILFDLLPLRQTYVNLGHDLPPRLIPTIDRMYPALRFFRHQDGDLALFNGAGATLANDLMSVLRYDESAGQTFKALPHSRYQRLSAGGAVAIVDTGPAPAGEISSTAHAGCLAFEFSSGRHRFIVNSGQPRFAGDRYQQMARATAAHSTLVLGDKSSARISKSRLLGPVMLGGVSEVAVLRRNGEDESDQLCARHDGYLRRFGVLHERDLRLNVSGTKLVGHDRLLTEKGEALKNGLPATAMLRFHIHPQIRLMEEDDHTILLEAPGGDAWFFSAPNAFPVVAEDVFFAGLSGIQPSHQIEVSLETPELWWFLSKRA
ncbi:heparinase II/III family protein [Allorhizobium undicola]|uniref:heparinase II/III family protein n=1 Tax=Allorhizobium undicola TaxID=78527 RepID=UPI003D328F2D